MVKKIVLIVLILSVISGLFVCTISNLIDAPCNADTVNRYKKEYNEYKSNENYAKQYKKLLNQSKAELLSNISAIIICSALIPLCAFAIYDLIRNPMRYAVEGAQQSYADYKEWREKVRAEREAAAKEARRAELERELAELKKTE